MKRFVMLISVAVVAGAMYVAAAPGSRQAAAPTAGQVATLKKQVAVLNRKLKALTKDEGKVKKLALDSGAFLVQCFLSQNAGVQGVSEFGDTSGTYGFHYLTAPGATTDVTRTALDFDASTTPNVYVQAVDPACVSTSAAALTHSRGVLAGHAERSR